MIRQQRLKRKRLYLYSTYSSTKRRSIHLLIVSIIPDILRISSSDRLKRKLKARRSRVKCLTRVHTQRSHQFQCNASVLAKSIEIPSRLLIQGSLYPMKRSQSCSPMSTLANKTKKPTTLNATCLLCVTAT